MTIHLTGNMSRAVMASKAQQVADRAVDFSKRDKILLGFYTANIASDLALLTLYLRDEKKKRKQQAGEQRYQMVISKPETITVTQKQALAINAYAHKLIAADNTPKLNVIG